MTIKENKTVLISYLYCFVGMFFFSTTELVGKFAGTAISPVVITIVRFFIGSALLLPVAYSRKTSKIYKITVKDLLLMGYPGVLNVAGAMLFLQFAIYYGTASTSALLISSNPVFVAILALFVLGEKLSLGKLLGIATGLAGIALVIKGDDPLGTTAADPFLGLVFGVLASFLFALYTVLAKKKIAVYGNFFFNTISFAAGALVLLIIASTLKLDFTFIITRSNLILLLYMGVFITGLAYIFFFAGLQNIPAANGSMFFFFKPIIAVILASLFLGEQITVWQLAGMALILFSIYITNIRRKPALQKVNRSSPA